jgi:peptide/nickel transport system substrate-binding protein
VGEGGGEGEKILTGRNVEGRCSFLPLTLTLPHQGGGDFRGLRLALLAVMLLAGCAAPQGPSSSQRAATGEAPRASAPKRVTAAVSGDPFTLNYQMSSAGSFTPPGSDALEELVNTGLASLDVRGSLAPRMAEAVPSTTNGLWKTSPDGQMETTWKIKPGAVWHDGTPFTSADLVFTADVVRDRDVGVFRDRAWDNIESVSAPDARTITVTWKRPYINADSLFTPQFAIPLPKHLLESAYLNNRAGFVDLPYWTDDFVGLGPFKLQSWERGSHLVVVANDRYVLGRPKVDEVEVRFIGDPNTMIANILSGAVDFNMGRGLNIEEADDVRARWPEGRLEAAPYTWIQLWPQFLTPDPPVVTEVAFRRAVLHAIDRQQMVDTFMRGLTTVAHSYLNPAEAEYKEIEPQIVKYDYDPRRATELLQGLGYRRGADGMFVDASSRKLSLEIRGNAGDELRRKLLFDIADELPKVGVAVDPVIVPIQRVSDLEYYTNYPTFTITQRPNQLRVLSNMHSSQATTKENNYTGANISRYMNPEFDALIDRYYVTIDQRERTGIVGQIMHRMTDEVLLLGLFYTIEPILVNNRIVAVGGRNPRSSHAWNAHEWDVK